MKFRIDIAPLVTTKYKELYIKFCILLKPVIILQVALASITLHKYYEKYEFRIVSSDITPMPNFIQIHPAILAVNLADRQTDEPYMRSIHACAKKQSFPQ